MVKRLAFVVTLITVLVLVSACAAPLPERGKVTIEGQERFVVAVVTARALPGGEGEGVVRAARMAMEDEAGRLGVPLELTEVDDNCDPARAAALAEELAQQPRLIGIVGPLCSGSCVAVQNRLVRRAIPLVTPRCTDVAVTRQGSDAVFRTGWTDAYDAVAASRYAKRRLKAERVFLVHEATIYGRGLRDVFKLFFGKDNLAGVEELPSDADDYGPAVRAIRKSDAEAVYFAGFTDNAVGLAQQLRAAGVTLPLLLPDAAGGPDLTEAAAGLDGTILVTEVEPATERSPGVFSGRYQQRFGTEPPPYAAEAYDAMLSLLTATSKAWSKDGNRREVDRRALIDRMHRVDAWGVTGRIRFRLNGDRLEETAVRVWQISGGRRTLREELLLEQ